MYFFYILFTCSWICESNVSTVLHLDLSIQVLPSDSVIPVDGENPGPNYLRLYKNVLI